MKLKRETELTPVEVLQAHWGYESFRPMQAEVIDSILSGHDTLVIMPTGGGKSVTFQVPALMCEGIAIVITPLVALMKDQVDSLRAKGIKATYLHSGLSRSETLDLLDLCLFSNYKLLYVSPERLQNKLFLRRLSSLQVSFIVVDECHCISQWGYDFRPDYLRIHSFRELLPATPVLALTASATPKVVEDITVQLQFGEQAKLFKRGFYRKNLSYVVRPTGDKLRETYHILRSVPGSALVYVSSRKKSRDIANFLVECGLSADYFHARLSPELKAKKQDAWQAGETRIMVCTNAFGMGIDKEDVRTVVHFSIPPSPESYYQEAGRAGRDNKKSYAVLLYAPQYDDRQLQMAIERNFPPISTLKAIYDAVGNFFQLGVESGEGALFEFDLVQFCRTFRYYAETVRSAFSLFYLAGYMEYLEDHFMPSRMQILADRNDLFELFGEREGLYEELLEYLLREYTGLFSEMVEINEQRIAKALEINAERLFTLLSNLKRWHIIQYIPGKRSNYVRYLQQRIPSKQLRIPKAFYKERKEGMEARIEAMSNYIHTDDACRVEVLMAYFGEEHPLPCGHCDYCLKHPAKGLSYRKIDQVEELLKLKQEVTIKEVVESLPHFTKAMAKKALEHLISEYHPIDKIERDGVSYYSVRR